MNQENKATGLDNVMIAAPCNVSWDSMSGNETVRHCHECKLNVFNISEMTAPEAEKLLGGEAYARGEVCLRLYRRADGTVITSDCPKGLQRIRAFSQKLSRLAAATFATLIATLPAFAQESKSTDGNAKTEKVVKQSADPKKPAEPIQILGGMPMPRPEHFQNKTNTGSANCTPAQAYAKGQIAEKAGDTELALGYYRTAVTEAQKDAKQDPKFVKTVEKALARMEKLKAKEQKKAGK